MVKEEAILHRWREYTADMLCAIARPNYKSELPLFSEMINKKDTKLMTANEIKQHVKSLLSE